MEGCREPADVASGHDAPGLEPAYRLRDSAHVVGDGGDAGAEGTQESSALVELGAVREDSDCGVAEGAVDFGPREVAEPPLHLEAVGGRAVPIERLERVARDEQAGVAGPAHGFDRVREPLVRPDHPEGEHRPAVVPPLRLARENGVGDDPEPFRLDTPPGERLPAVLAVHDDAVEARENPPPELGAVRRAAWEEIVRREDRRQVRAEEARVELGRGQPLDVEDVCVEAAQGGEPQRVLHDLERQAQRRAAEDA